VTEGTYQRCAEHVRDFQNHVGIQKWNELSDRDLDALVVARLEEMFLEGAASHRGSYMPAALEAFSPALGRRGERQPRRQRQTKPWQLRRAGRKRPTPPAETHRKPSPKGVSLMAPAP
jgi:hypothetical protein